MPSFNLTGEQASILVDYFAALSKDEANDLKDDLKRIHKYVAQSSDPESARDDWHRNGATASLAGLLRDYSLENELLKPYKFDFRKKDQAAIDEVYRDVLGNAEFFAHLYDIQYPFAYNDFTPMDVERYALGERLFGELTCLACHVLGDSAVPGSNPAPTAPNLALTHKRIRYEWFRQWMQEPRKMQPETNMPQWFPGGQSGFSEVMGYKDEMREALEAVYTSSGETQMKLLMDFIWQAGLTNHTVVDKSKLPGAGDAEAADVPPPADTAGKPQPAAQAMPKPEFRRISAAIIDQTTIGPRAARIVRASADAGLISGRVIWTGGEVPNDHLPVAPDFRSTCCPNQATKPLDRIRVDERTGGVRDCVVYLAGTVKMPPFPASKQPLEIAIRNCQFDRRVSLVPRGGRVRFVNDDDLAHNIRGRAGQMLLWSKNLFERGSTADLEVDKLGIIQTRSGSGFDWMDNYIWVVDHAGYALTDEEGSFTLEGIGPGEYTLHVWHPGIHMTTAGASGESAGPAVNFSPPMVVGGEISVQGAHETRVIVELQ
ncbi:MAG: c-type cytochrome, partial [Planctomycetes bacterium]|nr:c-type cytochrome [Planctomycetota bacterium]